MRSIRERLALAHTKRWNETIWNKFLRDCGVKCKHRPLLFALQKELNVKPLSPEESIKNRSEFLEFKKTQEYRDIVSASWGMKRFVNNEFDYKDTKKLPWEA